MNIILLPPAPPIMGPIVITPLPSDPDPLTVPIPLPSLSDQLKSFTDPNAIAACNDPLRRVAMVMVALSLAEADSLTEEVKDITSDTDEIAAANDVMRITNDANAKFKTSGDDTEVYYQRDIYDPTAPNAPYDYKASAEALRNRLINSGVDGTTLTVKLSLDNSALDPRGHRNPNFNPQLPNGLLYGVYTTKKNLDAATKNIQLHIDNLSSTTQQKQLFMQTLMGKFNGTYEVATAALKKMAEQNDAINQNIKR